MSELEKKILKDFYEFREGKRKKPIHTEYNLKYKGTKRAKHEFANYLIKLKEEGFLTFADSKVIVPGGIRDEEYMNSVAIIFTEYVKVTDKTKEIFELKRNKVAKVITNETKDVGKIVSNEVKNYAGKAIASLIIFGLLLLLLNFIEFF